MRIIRRVILILTLLAAVWLLSACQKTVTFDPNGGEVVAGETVQKCDAKNPAEAPEVTREGYRFRGWDADFSEPEADMTVKAEWDELYTVTFELDGGKAVDGTPTTQSVTATEKVKYPAVERDGYLFDDWDNDPKTVSENTVIKAKWLRLCTVTFNPNGGKAADPTQLVQIVPTGGSAEEPDVSLDFMELEKWDKSFDNITSNLTVNAVWAHTKLIKSEIYDYVNPGTVEINTYRYNDKALATGSGFFLTADGQIVTNFHVIEGAIKIKVKTYDGKEYTVTSILASDPERDLAILKITIGNAHVPDIAAARPKTGDAVYALGSPFGLEGTFTGGIVSATSRILDGVSYIQSTAQISEGNSGGPLVDETGCVVGINTMMMSDGQNLNFSIPIERLKELKRESMTVTSWVNKYGFSNHLINEKFVYEKEKNFDAMRNRVNNGETMMATLAPGQDIDLFSIVVDSVDYVLNPGDVMDMIYVIYTEDQALYLEIANYILLFTNLFQDGNSLKPVMYENEYYLSTYADGDGGYYLIIQLHDVLKIQKTATKTNVIDKTPDLMVAGELAHSGKYRVYARIFYCDEDCFTK